MENEKESCPFLESLTDGDLFAELSKQTTKAAVASATAEACMDEMIRRSNA